jgi:glycosyltransferase involved in cell wall biosynthesis
LKLLFVSNLFPDTTEPYRGLDNATLLHHLADRWDIRVLAIRPTLSAFPSTRQSRPQDEMFATQYVSSLYVPKIGSRWNHQLMANALTIPLGELLPQFPFDVLLGSWIFPDCCAVAELARDLESPFVAIAQGSDVHQYLQMPVRRKIITRLLPSASAVVTRSAELARLLAESGLPRERLHPIYNGIDLDLFQPGDRSAARRELHLPANAPVILFVGNFYGIKNPDIAVKALARLSSPEFKTPPVLVMVGGGKLEAQIRELAASLSVADRVILAGRTDAAGVARHMQVADVLCLPSTNEGVPNVILEAFASGLPVVASRVGGIPEVHPGDDFGKLVAPIEPAAFTAALREVLLSPRDPARIREHALQFSWKRAADAYHELLSQAQR